MKPTAKGEGLMSAKGRGQAQMPPPAMKRHMVSCGTATVRQQHLVKDAARPEYPLWPKFCHSCHGNSTLHSARGKQ